MSISLQNVFGIPRLFFFSREHHGIKFYPLINLKGGDGVCLTCYMCRKEEESANHLLHCLIASI